MAGLLPGRLSSSQIESIKRIESRDSDTYPDKAEYICIHIERSLVNAVG
jgi:hypothetical protein